MREHKDGFGARDANVEQSALFFEHRRIVVRSRQRKEAIFEAGQIHHRVFESLGVVQRHHGDRIGRRIERIGTGHQHRLLQKTIEWRETHFAIVIGQRLGATAHQLAHVLDPIESLGPFRTQQVEIADARDECFEEFIDGGFGGHFAKRCEHGCKVRKGCAGRRPKFSQERRGAGGLEKRDPCGCRSRCKQLDRRITEAAARHTDGAPECFVVGRVRDQFQIRHQVANFASIVEPHGADEPIGPATLPHRVFKGPTLRVGAVQNRHLPHLDGATAAAIGDIVRDVFRLIALVERPHAAWQYAGGPRGAQRFSATFLVA